MTKNNEKLQSGEDAVLLDDRYGVKKGTIVHITHRDQMPWFDGKAVGATYDACCIEDSALKKVNKETKVGRRTFKLVKDTADLKKGAIVQEACDDGDQEYKLLDRNTYFKFDDYETYFDGTPEFTRKSVEENPKYFVEVFPATEAYLTKEEVKALKEFLKGRK